MSHFIEAIVSMLPIEAGGRTSAVAPRDGSYRPFARHPDGSLLRLRFIEGPPSLKPGDSARVVVELEEAGAPLLEVGTELDLMELDPRPIGIVTVARLWRASPVLAPS